MRPKVLILLPFLVSFSNLAASGDVANDLTTSAGSTQTSFPSEAEIHALLVQRVRDLNGENAGIGIVVGVIGPHGRRVISYGQSGNSRPLDGDTAFEIGSVSKVFTALLLADMARKGEVALTDPVTKHLPANRTIPERKGQAITLVDLATHTSGLPFMPDDLPEFSDVAAAKDADATIYGFVARTVPGDIGTQWNYSNLGYWLLGKAMEFREKQDYETLLRERILVPLKLNETAVTISPALKRQLAVGHNAILQPAPLFSSIPVYGAMSSAGGLVSTTSDLLAFLGYFLGYEPSPLAASMAWMLRTQRPMDGDKQALGWVVSGSGPDQLIFHEGGSFGYVSDLVWSPARRVGVVILSNQMADVSDIARHLLQSTARIERPLPTKHTEVTLDGAKLGAYRGRYEGPEGVGAFSVTQPSGKDLAIKVPNDWGLPRLYLHPSSATDFFVAEIPLRVSFQITNARVTGISVYPPRGQHAITATRVSSQ